MKGYIYLIENKINGKKYVGKTYNTISSRWSEHCQERKRSKHRPLYRAMNKYGIENFSIKEIEYTDNLEEREIYWIEYFNSYHNGYNATLGGDGKAYFEYKDEEVIKKYLSNQSVKETAEYFSCDIDTIRKRLRNNGIHIPSCGNINANNRYWKTKQILQFDLNGKYLQTFSSQSEAAKWIKENNYSKGQEKHIVSNISKNARGLEHRKQAYGFVWKYKNNGE